LNTNTAVATTVSFQVCLVQREKHAFAGNEPLSSKEYLFPQPERWKKVKRSMAVIKVVLGERKHEKINEHALKMQELKMQE
jgi:hypothetical protein